MGNRRLVVDPRHRAFVAGYARAVRDLRAEMSAAHFSTLAELNVLRRQVGELRAMHNAYVAAIREAQATALARAQAHAAHRERELTRAWAAERDISQPLH